MNDLGTALLDYTILLETPAPGVQDRILAKLSEGLVKFMAPNDRNLDEAASLFNYRQIAETVNSILNDLDIGRLFLVLDEWAQIPLAAQPYVAEFIKRALLTVQRVSVKLLAVNYHCKFTHHIKTNIIGLHRVADFPH